MNMEGMAPLGPDALGLLPDYLTIFIEPPTGPLLFLYLLAAFFIAARLVKSWPPLLVLLAAMALEFVLANVEFSFKVGDKFCRYFVFFIPAICFRAISFAPPAGRNNVRVSHGRYSPHGLR